MEYLVMGVFCASLVLCVALNFSILYALAFGLALFMLYGRRKGFSWRELCGMAFSGVRTVRNILITFVLIGVMTALWRAAGTIAVIVCFASRWIRPSVFLLTTFLINSGLSVLTGTSFGTAATMGVICAAMGRTMGVSPVLTGGAVLSGAFFGDRCSPVSTSALLVATVTGTDIYDNLRRMARCAAVPFAATCLIYLALGLAMPGEGAGLDLEALYARAFRLSPWAIVPAAVILLLAALRVKVKLAMGASILAAGIVCAAVQGVGPAELLRTAVLGFSPADPEVAAMVGGGGIFSMARVACIVCLSSAYSEIFNRTGLLDGARRLASALARRTTPYIATLAASTASALIACNQTLTILLANQLCGDLYADKGSLAEDLEDSAVVIAPLVPWSIAGAVPLAAVGAPTASVAAAFYLVLLPLYRGWGSRNGWGRVRNKELGTRN